MLIFVFTMSKAVMKLVKSGVCEVYWKRLLANDDCAVMNKAYLSEAVELTVK